MKHDPHGVKAAEAATGDSKHPAPSGAEQAVARLLRLAGSREPPPVACSGRVKDAAKTAWRGAVRRHARRVLWKRGALALGAAAALLLAFAYWRGLLSGSREKPVVAVLQRTAGTVWLTQRAASGEAIPTPESPIDGALAAGAWVETGPSGRAALRLVPGASLRLDVSTRVRLVSQLEVLLQRGAVYVDTGGAKTSSRLEVRTPVGVARDIGTQFEVRFTEDALRLRVREGAIDLACSGRVHAAREGEELRLGVGGGVERGQVPLNGREWEWAQAIAPSFALEGRSLHSFLEWYARETRYTIDTSRVPVTMQADRVTLHGAIEGLALQEALQAVLPTCGLSHRLDGAVLIIEPLT